MPAPSADDPVEQQRERARRLLDTAQHDVATAAARTRAVLHEVARAAPELDGGFWKGAGDAWKDLFAFAARAVTQPSDTARATADEVVGTATHPRQALEQETDELNRRPDEYLGGMVATGPLGPLGRALRRITDDDTAGETDGESDAEAGEGDDDTSGDDTAVLPLDLPRLWHHIFGGEINRWGRPVGYHHRRGGVDPPDRELLGPVTDGDQGTYSVPNVLFTRPDGTQVKKGYTSFFPDDWWPDQVQGAVSEAFRSPDVIVESDGSWQGYSSSGLMIRGFVGKHDQPASAYPYVPTKGTP